VFFIGELLLYIAAGLTLWSMWVYLSSAWPIMMDNQAPQASLDRED
jgi:hypothetical protein